MATRYLDSLEELSPKHERRSLLASGENTSSRSPSVERCFLWTDGLCSLAFLFLGACILSLGVVTSGLYSGAYMAGGGAELLLGVCLLVRLLSTCKKCSGLSRNGGNTTSCVLFTALAVLFLVWCTTVCCYCAALVMSALQYKEENGRVIAAMSLSVVSLVLEFVFGASVCYRVGCPAD